MKGDAGLPAPADKPTPAPKITPEQKSASLAKVAEFRGKVAAGTLTAADVRTLPFHLAALSVPELQSLKAELGAKGGGRKAELVGKLKAWAAGATKGPGAGAAADPEERVIRAIEKRFGVADSYGFRRVAELTPIKLGVVARDAGLTPDALKQLAYRRSGDPRLRPPPDPAKAGTPLTLDALRSAVRSSPEGRVSEIKARVAEHSVPDGGPQIHGMTNPEPSREVSFQGLTIKYPAGTEEAVATTLYSLLDSPAIPAKLWAAQSQIVFTTQKNRNDPYWERKYNKKDFVSAGTGGDGDVCVYNGSHLTASSLSHEFGHNLAFREWGSTQPPADSEYGRAQRAEKPVSAYGAKSPSEDFAEACEQYSGYKITDIGSYADPAARENLRRDFPLKFAALQKIIGEG